MGGVTIKYISLKWENTKFVYQEATKFCNSQNDVSWRVKFLKKSRFKIVRAGAEVVATKLGIILSLFLLSFFFFPSTYFSPRRGLPMKLKFKG